MRPAPWSPPVALLPHEAAFVGRLKRRSRFFILLRELRHELLSTDFQAELAASFADSPKGQPPIPPGQLALATLLQAHTGLSDEAVIDTIVADRRWQLVLDCWGADRAPFAQGTLVAFRQRLVAANLDRRLIERTIELAEGAGGFNRRRLRLALDSSPIWGAGRVEDTYNLIGTALRRALTALGQLAGRGRDAEALARNLPELAGPSLKAALDLDWREDAARDTALAQVLAVLDRLEQQLATAPSLPTAVAASVHRHLRTARQVVAQDVVTSPAGTATLRAGVAPDRRISVTDAEMRHGRKSKAVRFDGYKQHLVRDLDQAGLLRAVGVTPASRPEREVAPAIQADLARQAVEIAEWHVDRAYLRSAVVTDRAPTTVIWCKPYLVKNGDRFPKTAFAFDAERQQLTCPTGRTRPAVPGQTVRFRAADCDGCGLRAQCTTSRPGVGRSVTLHPEEVRLGELRQAVTTVDGRAKLRERVPVEHGLARLGQVRGDTARYRGLRNQLFEARRAAAVVNLQTLDRLRLQPPRP